MIKIPTARGHTAGPLRCGGIHRRWGRRETRDQQRARLTQAHSSSKSAWYRGQKPPRVHRCEPDDGPDKVARPHAGPVQARQVHGQHSGPAAYCTACTAGRWSRVLPCRARVVWDVHKFKNHKCDNKWLVEFDHGRHRTRTVPTTFNNNPSAPTRPSRRVCSATGLSAS